MAESKSPQELLTDQISEIRKSINKKREKFEKHVKKVQKHSKKLLTLFYEEDKYPEFDKPSVFWNGMQGLNDHFGNALYAVRKMEDDRLALAQKIESLQRLKMKGGTGQGISINTPAPTPILQEPGGLTGYLGKKAVAKSREKMQKVAIEAEREREAPKIASQEKIVDLTEYGRQLLPEYNKIINYFQPCLDRLFFFPSEASKSYYHGELRKQLLIVTNICSSFCRCAVEYRDAFLDELEMMLAKGMTEVVVAQMIGAGRMELSEIYKRLRQERGPTEF